MAVTNSLTERPEQKKQGITAFLNSRAVQNQIMDVVGGRDGQKFITSVVSAVNANAELAKCDNGSIFCAALLGQSLKLSPSPQLGHFYMVPFNDKESKMKKAQFMLGYKGYIQLALRSGMYKKLNVVAVKEGELVKYDPFNEDIEVNPIEDPDERERARTVGYYAFFEYISGFRKCIYWSREKMLNHADKYAQSFSRFGYEWTSKGQRYKKVSFEDFINDNYDKTTSWMYSSNWYQNFDDMAFKTMLRQLISKWGIMSIEMQTAFESDNCVIEDSKGTAKYVDNDMIIDMSTPDEGMTIAEVTTGPASASDALFG